MYFPYWPLAWSNHTTTIESDYVCLSAPLLIYMGKKPRNGRRSCAADQRGMIQWLTAVSER